MAFTQLNKGIHFDGTVRGSLELAAASGSSGTILLTLAPSTTYSYANYKPAVTVFSTDTFKIVMNVIEGGQNAPRVQFTASTHDPSGPVVQTISTNSTDSATSNEEITIALRYDNTAGSEVFELSLASRRSAMGDDTEYVVSDNGVAWSTMTDAGSATFAENFEGFVSQVAFLDGTATPDAVSGMVLDPGSVVSTDPSVLALYDFTSVQSSLTVPDSSFSSGANFTLSSTSDGSPVAVTSVDYWVPRNATVALSEASAPEGSSVTATVTIDAPAGPDGHAVRLELTGTAKAESDHGVVLRLSNGTEATLNIGTDQELQDVVDGGDAYYLVLKSTNYNDLNAGGLGYPSNVYSLDGSTASQHAYNLLKVAKTDGSPVVGFGDGGSMVLPFVGNWQQDPAQLVVDQSTGKLLFSAIQSATTEFSGGVNIYDPATGAFESNIPIPTGYISGSFDTLLGAVDGVLFYSESTGTTTPGNLFVIDQSTGSVVVEAAGVLPNAVTYHHLFNDGSHYSSDVSRRYVEESFGAISPGAGSPLFAFSRANGDGTSDLVWIDVAGVSRSVPVPVAGGKFTDTGYVVLDGGTVKVFDWGASDSASNPTETALAAPSADLAGYGTLVGTDLLAVGQDGQTFYLSTEVSDSGQSRYLVQKLDLVSGTLTLDTSFGVSGVLETSNNLVDRANFAEGSGSISNSEIHVTGDGSGLASFEGIDLYNADISIDSPAVTNNTPNNANRSAYENTINVIDTQGNVTQKTYVDVYIEPGQTSGYVMINLLSDGVADSDTLGVRVVSDPGYTNNEGYVGDWQGPAAPTVSDGAVATLSVFEPGQVLLDGINYDSDIDTYYSGTYNRIVAEFRDLPDALIGPNSEGIALNFSSSSVTLPGGSVLAAESGRVLDQVVQLGDYDALFDKSYLHYYSFRGSEGDDYVVTDEAVSTVVAWSPGDDHIVMNDAAPWQLFSAWTYHDYISAEDLALNKGLTFDNSGASFQVVTSLGTTTVEGAREFFDSSFNDVFIGGDGADIWKTRHGGLDTVTGGGGMDQWEIQYGVDRDTFADDWRDLTGMHITDYESGENIQLQSMGFDVSAQTSLEEVYNDIIVSFDGTNTNISVVNDTVNLQNIVTVAGQLEVLSVDYLEQTTVAPWYTVNLVLQDTERLITTTDLTGVAVGDLVESSFYEFDYFDLTDLTGEWVIDAAFGGIGTEGADVGTVWYWGSADYYDFHGFEGYIIRGNSDGTYAEYLGATGTDEIVVVEGGSDLFVDLGLDSTADVLSFRGTNDGVTIDLSAADQFGVTSFNLASSVDPNGEVRGADYLFGSEAGDDFTGYTDESNILAGYGGADDLTGGGLSDVLIGGTGNDLLSGLAGNDVLIDLDDGTLTGGDGNDLFVVRGTNNTGTNTEVADFELGANGPGLGGGNKSYADRIAFNFSVTALASTSLSAAEGGLLSNLDYETLENLISIDITEGNDPSRDFTITATLSAANQTDTNAVDITLGTLDVTLDPNTTLDTTKERLEYRIEDQEDFLASIKSTVLDQMLYNESALSVAGIQTDTSQMLDDTVNLFISLVREDKFAVPGGQGKPVLVALRENGVDLGTNFRPGKGNEVIAAGRADDKITIQRDEEMSLSDTYGRDTVVERGGDNDQIIMPLSLQDLLDTDDLDLSRVQRGREGEGKTLRIEYSDSTRDADSINDVDLMVYKQYNDYSTSFRVENLTLYNDDGTNTNTYVEVNYDLGTVTATGLETTSEDAILVGRSGIADEMVVKFNAGEAGLDNILDIVLADVTAEDTVSIEGYGNVTSVADGSETNATTDHQVVTTDTGYTINLYFTDYSPTNDDWLLNTITA